jgi:hypothetical protein
MRGSPVASGISGRARRRVEALCRLIAIYALRKKSGTEPFLSKPFAAGFTL